MRAYIIRVTSADLVRASGPGEVLALYTSFNPDGSTNGAALRVELDIPSYAYGDPAGLALVRIHGVNFADIVAANNLNGADITVYGGMSKGLPLANPQQAGVLLAGEVFQCFGNWQGIHSSLELMVAPKAGTNAAPVNLSYNWKKGTTLQDCVTQTLKIAFPNAVITGSLSSSLVYTEDQPFAYSTLQQFAKWVADTSHAINPDPNYRGAQITATPNGFNLFDGTTTPTAKEISFLDLIGQPTWLDAGTMQFKTVMRADLKVGDLITMPKGSNVINTPNSFSRFRSSTAFQGQFQIRNIRHVGDSRQASADSWCTVIDTYSA